MKRFIDIKVPVETCNFRCHYCYIAQQHRFNNALPNFKYTPEYIGRALSAERLGGIAHINMCGGGETLLPKEMPQIIYELLKQGHYIFVVTNGSAFKRFDEILELVPNELLKHLGFKFSFHYLELKRLNLLDKFFDNIKKVWSAGCSFSLELTPNDELIPLIPEIKEVCLKNVGALCHISVARDDRKKDVPILTNLSREQYLKTWGEFNSEFFDFKMSTFNVKRKEFCYAGAWSGYLDLGTGEMRQCYCGNVQNIYENLDKKIDFQHCIGWKCREPHCFNSHAFLTVGLIPELETPTYAIMRNRTTIDGKEWLSQEMKEFLSHQLKEENQLYTDEEKKKYGNKRSLDDIKYYIKQNFFRPILYTFKKGNYNE